MQVVDQNLQRRKGAIPEVEALMEEELEGYRRWKGNLVVKPIVKLLFEHFESVRQCEVLKGAKPSAKGDVENVEKITRLILGKLLHHPTEVLKSYDPESEEGQQALAIVCKLFDLK
jgi:glutamyl-tRNA reductase